MTKTVTIAATRTNGDPYAHHEVIVTLVAGSAGGVVGSSVVVEQSTVKLDADGEGSIVLATNDVEITDPAESFYRFTVAGSSPTITRSIALTDDLASTVSWTLADIQVGDPVVPGRSVSSNYVKVPGGDSLTNWMAELPTGGAGSGAASIDLLLATSAADGTATTFDILVWDQNAEASGNVPARYDSVATLASAAAFKGALNGSGFADGDTVTVLVPGGSAQGVWQFTPATITDPWTEVEASLVIQTSGGYLGVDLGSGWRKLNDADTIGYAGTGLLLNLEKVHQALHQLEGILDRWSFVSGQDMTGTVDVNATNPPLAYGECVPGARVFIDGLHYHVGGDGTLTVYEHPDVFDPPGQGARTTLVAPGDPSHGRTYMWLDDDRMNSVRAGSTQNSATPGDPGEWILTFDPTASGGGLDEAAVQALIDASVAALLDGAPGALDTLNELAAALGDDPNFAATITAALAGKASSSHNHAGVYQPADSDLTAIAALTTAAFGRSLLELTDAAGARTALGTAYGLAASTVVEGIALPRKAWRSGSYYGTDVPIANSGNAMASGTVRAMGFYNPVAGRSIDQIAIDVFSASGTPGAILYVMLDDGTGYPGAVVASGTITPAATSRQPASVSYTLPRGQLWLAAHSTAATWAGLTLAGPSPYLPVNPTYSANPMSCWQVTGAGTSLLTAFPAGGTQSANGMQILVRAA